MLDLLDLPPNPLSIGVFHVHAIRLRSVFNFLALVPGFGLMIQLIMPLLDLLDLQRGPLVGAALDEGIVPLRFLHGLPLQAIGLAHLSTFVQREEVLLLEVQFLRRLDDSWHVVGIDGLRQR